MRILPHERRLALPVIGEDVLHILPLLLRELCRLVRQHELEDGQPVLDAVLEDADAREEQPRRGVIRRILQRILHPLRRARIIPEHEIGAGALVHAPGIIHLHRDARRERLERPAIVRRRHLLFDLLRKYLCLSCHCPDFLSSLPFPSAPCPAPCSAHCLSLSAVCSRWIQSMASTRLDSPAAT